MFRGRFFLGGGAGGGRGRFVARPPLLPAARTVASRTALFAPPPSPHGPPRPRSLRRPAAGRDPAPSQAEQPGQGGPRPRRQRPARANPDARSPPAPPATPRSFRVPGGPQAPPILGRRGRRRRLRRLQQIERLLKIERLVEEVGRVLCPFAKTVLRGGSDLPSPQRGFRWAGGAGRRPRPPALTGPARASRPVRWRRGSSRRPGGPPDCGRCCGSSWAAAGMAGLAAPESSAGAWPQVGRQCVPMARRVRIGHVASVGSADKCGQSASGVRAGAGRLCNPIKYKAVAAG